MEIDQQLNNEEIQEVRIIESGLVLSEDRTVLISYTGNKPACRLPNTVKVIANGAFGNCYALYSIQMTENLTTIGKGAFEYCTRLASITIPDSVTEIEEYAFAYCSIMYL